MTAPRRPLPKVHKVGDGWQCNGFTGSEILIGHGRNPVEAYEVWAEVVRLEKERAWRKVVSSNLTLK